MNLAWKKLCMSAVGMILVLLLAGCGLNQKTEEQDGQAEEKTKISIAWWGLENRRQIMEELIQIYEEEHTDIEFEMIPMGWEWYFDWLSMQAASGSMPDIVQMDYMYLSTYTRNGSLADLQEFVENGIIDTSYIDKRYVDAGREGIR